MNTQTLLRIHPKDDFLVALRNLKAGEQLPFEGETYRIQEDIAVKHKVALRDIKQGESTYLYGVKVGISTKPIPKGGGVHQQNLKHAAQTFTEKTGAFHWNPPDLGNWKDATFLGYHRANGAVGTANHWVVIPLVFCENSNLMTLKDVFLKGLGYDNRSAYHDLMEALVRGYQAGDNKDQLLSKTIPQLNAPSHPLFENIDGVQFLNHDGGCGGSRDDSEALCRLIAGYINHPNVAGATILSLGCQNAQLGLLQRELKRINPSLEKPVLAFEQQKYSSENEMLGDAIKQTFVHLIEVNQQKRKPAPLSKLVIGVECGGSDGFSGISANPTIGYVSDMAVALGGSAILSEFPELCGVEQEIINRCVDTDTANRFIELIRAYEKRADSVGAHFDMNPSPGNIKDGLITDAMKSAGAAKKGGSSPVVDVLDYAECVKQSGLNLLCTPGNDVESTTGLAAAGANLILFSTGLGTPTGNPVTPVIKISSNTKIYQNLNDMIDFDAGPVIQGEKTIEQMGNELLKLCQAIASGEQTAKAFRLGQTNFLPWKRGISL